jgi:hypothetical protein
MESAQKTSWLIQLVIISENMQHCYPKNQDALDTDNNSEPCLIGK